MLAAEAAANMAESHDFSGQAREKTDPRSRPEKSRQPGLSTDALPDRESPLCQRAIQDEYQDRARQLTAAGIRRGEMPLSFGELPVLYAAGNLHEQNPFSDYMARHRRQLDSWIRKA